jgi:hypothetical protein
MNVVNLIRLWAGVYGTFTVDLVFREPKLLDPKIAILVY